MKKILAVLSMVAILCFAGECFVFAQTEQPAAQAPAVETKGMTAFGTISKIEKNQIVLLEYNEETDVEEEKAYVVDEKTQFSDELTLEDFLIGDPIEISYAEQDGKKVAQSIKLEDTFLEGDEWEDIEVGLEEGTALEDEKNQEEVSR